MYVKWRRENLLIENYDRDLDTVFSPSYICGDIESRVYWLVNQNYMDIITVFKSVSITCFSIDAASSQYNDKLIWVILLSNKNLKMHLISHASWTDTCIEEFIVFCSPGNIV